MGSCSSTVATDDQTWEKTLQRGKFLSKKFQELYYDGENDEKLNPEQIGELYKEHYLHEKDQVLLPNEVKHLLEVSGYLPRSVVDQYSSDEDEEPRCRFPGSVLDQ